MSTQLVLGVVGGVVGSFFGMPQLGFMLGSAIGGAIDVSRQKIEGPRINDLKVQSSTYGGLIPIIYGTWRVSGNVIWSLDNLREIKNTSRQGKGGPKVTTYTYVIDIAIALSAGTMHGIRKMWANGKLVYDVSTDSSASTIIASALKADSFVFYPGDDTQLPDPTIEATLGVGKVPAYRGTCYVVFGGLECPNGQIPQLSFELMAEASEAPPTDELVDLWDDATADGGAAIWTVTQDVIYVGNTLSSNSFPVWIGGNGFKKKLMTVDTTWFGVGVDSWTGLTGGTLAVRVVYPDDGGIDLEKIDMQAGTWGVYFHFDAGTLDFANGGAFDPISTKIILNGGPGREPMIVPPGAEVNTTGNEALGVAAYDNVFYTLATYSGHLHLRVHNAAGELVDVVEGPALGSVYMQSYASADGVFVYLGSTFPTNSSRVYKVDVDAHEWHLLTSSAPLMQPGQPWYANNQYMIAGPGYPLNSEKAFLIHAYAGFEPEAVTLQSIVTDICGRAGLAPELIEYDGVDQTVHGYAITRVSSARGSLQPLLRGYAIDAQETDGKLRFLWRGNQVSAATIPYDDLGTAEDGSEPSEPFALNRQQQDELPDRVTVNFIDPANDYETASESAARQTVDTDNDMVEEFPVATTPAHAASIADMWLHDAWTVRDRRSFFLQRKWAPLDAGDLVTVEYPDGTTQTVRLAKVTDTGLRLECEAEPADGVLYTVERVGTSPATPQTVDAIPGPTELVLLDIPLLRDADDNPGLYAALSGLGPGWRGAELFSGLTEEELTSKGAVTRGTVIGFAETVLPVWPYNMPDEGTVLVVQVGPEDELFSTTHANLIGTDANAFAIGADDRWEICKFRTAADLGDGRWQLTGLLRGQRGTEWAMGLHEANDEFVLLQFGGLLRPVMELASLDQEFLYKAVSSGRDPDTTASVEFANEGVGLRPLAPVNLRVSEVGEVVTVDADRRSRLRDNWLAGRVPLGEAVEAWEVEIETPSGGLSVYPTPTLPVDLVLSAFQPLGLDAENGAARFALVLSGYVYAVQNSVLIKMDATTLERVGFVACSVATTGLCTDGTSLFTVGQGNPANGVFPTVNKFSQALAPLAFQTLDALADGAGMVFCAGDLWVTLPYTGVVRRMNTALATVADVTVAAANIMTDDTLVYVIGVPDTCSTIDPATNTVVDSFTMDGRPLGVRSGNEASVAAGLLFAPSSDEGLTVYDLSNGLRFTHSIDANGPTSAAGDLVTVRQNREVTLINAPTVTTAGSFTIPADPYSGQAPSLTVLTEDRLIVRASDASTDYYERGELQSGSLVRVYQMSAAVGRGFPATYEVP